MLGGGSARQRPSANGQRVEKRQPDGIAPIDGT
jgi:hypothetical protein